MGVTLGYGPALPATSNSTSRHRSSDRDDERDNSGLVVWLHGRTGQRAISTPHEPHLPGTSRMGRLGRNGGLGCGPCCGYSCPVVHPSLGGLKRARERGWTEFLGRLPGRRQVARPEFPHPRAPVSPWARGVRNGNPGFGGGLTPAPRRSQKADQFSRREKPGYGHAMIREGRSGTGSFGPPRGPKAFQGQKRRQAVSA